MYNQMYIMYNPFGATVPVRYGNTNPSLGSTSAGSNISPESTNQFNYGSYQPEISKYYIKDVLFLIRLIKQK